MNKKNRRAFIIEIIVHYPKTAKGQAELSERIAKIHAQFVLQYVNKLNCPLEQKKKLIDAVVQALQEKAAQEEKSPTTAP